MPHNSIKLTIAIPALNEEQTIRNIVEASLAARDRIVRETPVDTVDVTVISDGSTDRTVEYAQSFGDRIELIIFEKNRGYGAAIKEGWRRSDAQLLGFLDADGTCNPEFFADLSGAILKENADIALGCRMNPASRMPALRRVGNTLFALLLSLLSLDRVRDTASGMRVVRRSCLPRLMPLPDGLNFTPAMTARALLARDIKLIERDMPYDERGGESKLHVLRDGVQFLKVILTTAFLHRPTRPLGFIALAMLGAAVVWMIYPTWFWVAGRSSRRVDDLPIPRLRTVGLHRTYDAEF